MPNATITVDAALKARLADLASQSGQPVDAFVEALLRRIASADIRFDRGLPIAGTRVVRRSFHGAEWTTSPTDSQLTSLRAPGS